MALIVCSECGKEFSDTASACPHCGFQKKPPSGKVASRDGGCSNQLGCIIGFIVVVFVMFVFVPFC